MKLGMQAKVYLLIVRDTLKYVKLKGVPTKDKLEDAIDTLEMIEEYLNSLIETGEDN